MSIRMSPLAVLGGELGLGYLLSPRTKPIQGFDDAGELNQPEPAGTHGCAHPAPHSLACLPRSHSEQAHVASRPQRWHLVIVGVCAGDIYGAVFHVPLELSGQEAPSACVINIIYCYKSPSWSLWPWQLEIFVTLVWAQLLCSGKKRL